MKVLQLLFIMVITSCLFTFIIYKISMYKMKKEKMRNLIMCDLIDLEGDCIEYLNTKNLRDFPKIEKQIKEVSIILDRITYDANIDKIKLVKIKSNETLIREFEMLEREKKRLNDEKANMILLRKTIIINAIAQYNFPLSFIWTIIKDIIVNKNIKVTNKKILPKIFFNSEKRTSQYKVSCC